MGNDRLNVCFLFTSFSSVFGIYLERAHSCHKLELMKLNLNVLLEKSKINIRKRERNQQKKIE
jgi:hypothetical protein